MQLLKHSKSLYVQIKSDKFLIYVTLEGTHEFHETSHSVTFIVVVSSHQR